MARRALSEDEKRKPVNVSLSPEAIALLGELAVGRGLNVSALVEQLIREEARRVERRR